jgi:hypothetical protein
MYLERFKQYITHIMHNQLHWPISVYIVSWVQKINPRPPTSSALATNRVIGFHLGQYPCRMRTNASDLLSGSGWSVVHATPPSRPFVPLRCHNCYFEEAHEDVRMCHWGRYGQVALPQPWAWCTATQHPPWSAWEGELVWDGHASSFPVTTTSPP